MELSQIYLYRITDIRNVPHILKNGITHRSSVNSNEYFVPIGDRSLISFRDSKKINIKGNVYILGKFTPFYFGVRMPMLYVIQHGFNCTEAISPDEIIYIAVSLKSIVQNDELEYYFSDGHGTDLLTTFYDKTDIMKLPEILDWQAITARIWSGEGIDVDLKRRKQAEFLVSGDIPVEYIHGYVCYNEIAKRKLIGFGIEEEKIKIFPEAYY